GWLILVELGGDVTDAQGLLLLDE
ncbi:MAG: hypothetical protein JWO42_2139, partial [Chloroflexi bacterium]|nr:hypothetical protein [Chloroflexota bacterium]